MSRLDYDALIEDVEFLIGVGEHPVNIPRRVGRTPSALLVALRRAERNDLAQHFYAIQRATQPRNRSRRVAA